MAIISRPDEWWAYVIGGVVALGAIAESVWVVKRARIEVDDHSIKTDDAYWGARSMPRINAVAVVRYGRVWKVQGRDGSILRLRTLWSRQQLAELADELGVPLQTSE